MLKMSDRKAILRISQKCTDTPRIHSMPMRLKSDHKTRAASPTRGSHHRIQVCGLQNIEVDEHQSLSNPLVG